MNYLLLEVRWNRRKAQGKMSHLWFYVVRDRSDSIVTSISSNSAFQGPKKGEIKPDLLHGLNAASRGVYSAGCYTVCANR